jgi:uncharacterized protein YecT (DUF1311 family)
MKLSVAILAPALVMASQSWAQDETVDCENAMAQQDMNICAGKDFEAADADLNKVWQEAIASAKEADAGMADDGRPGHEETLRKAQRAWIAFRDAQCEYDGFEARGGSMEPMLVSGCLAELTRQRTKQLQDGENPGE